MIVLDCPECGRQPKITECVPFKSGKRRRMCRCPNFCSVIPGKLNGFRSFGLMYYGDGDDNVIWKAWNAAVTRYECSKTLKGYDHLSVDNDPNIELI